MGHYSSCPVSARLRNLGEMHILQPTQSLLSRKHLNPFLEPLLFSVGFQCQSMYARGYRNCTGRPSLWKPGTIHLAPGNPILTSDGGCPGGSWEWSQTRCLKRKKSEGREASKEPRGEQNFPKGSKPLTVHVDAERCFVFEKGSIFASIVIGTRPFHPAISKVFHTEGESPQRKL